MLPTCPIDVLHPSRSVQQDPERRSARRASAIMSLKLSQTIQRVWDDKLWRMALRKVWRRTRNEKAIVVARCTRCSFDARAWVYAPQLVRGRRMKTTAPDELLGAPVGPSAIDNSTYLNPNALWVARSDLPPRSLGSRVCPTWHPVNRSAYARSGIVGWRVSSSAAHRPRLGRVMEHCALYDRHKSRNVQELIHHSDREPGSTSRFAMLNDCKMQELNRPLAVLAIPMTTPWPRSRSTACTRQK